MTTYDLPKLPSPAVPDIFEKSQETMSWLRNMIRIGFTDERGPAWWANGAVTKAGEWVGIPDGSHFPGPVPIEEVRKLLDVKLVKGAVTISYEDANGNVQTIEDPDTQPIINAGSGQVFSYPKEGYKIHPYLRTLHGFITQITHDEEAVVGSCGLLKKGGLAFLQAVLPKHYEVAGYGYRPYLSAVTSADLSLATTYITGADGQCCDNTVTRSLADALTKLKIKHSRNSGVSVQHAREKLGVQLAQVGEIIGDAIDKLTNEPVSGREFEKWMNLAVPIPEKQDGSSTGGRSYTMAINKRDELVRLWTEDDKVHPWAGTAFGVYQLDNTYRTWNGIVRNAPGGRLERNFTNDALGITAKNDTDALDLLAQVKAETLVIA